jgi:hypothetical protein
MSIGDLWKTGAALAGLVQNLKFAVVAIVVLHGKK